MTEFNKTRKEISIALDNVWYENGDLSDIGNEIGVIIAKHFSDKMGYDLDSFIHGLKHGVSLIDDTHNNPVVINDRAYNEAIKHVRESYCDQSNSLNYMLLGDVAELIKITTGKEVNVMDLLNT